MAGKYRGWPQGRPSTTRSRALAAGYRSGLEEALAKDLAQRDVPFTYEEQKVSYVEPATSRRYTPDFILPNGIVVETKGRFTVEDRKKHLWIKEQRPGIDLRFVFSNPRSKIRKGSPTSYADWCEKNGFLYAAKTVPQEWIDEPADAERFAALRDADPT